MLENLAPSVQFVLKHEGGFTIDSGGPTMHGVTQRVYSAWRKSKGLVDQTVRAISNDEVQSIYKFLYWDHIHGDDLPTGVDYTAFDYAINSGPYQAAKDLQRAINSLGFKIKVDGNIGPTTLDAAKDCDPQRLVNAIIAIRMSFLRRLRNWFKYGTGWKARVLGRPGEPGVIDNAKVLIRNSQLTADSNVPVNAPAVNH